MKCRKIFSSFLFWNVLSLFIGFVSYIGGVWGRYNDSFDCFFLLSMYFVPFSLITYVSGILFSYYLSNQYKSFFITHLLNKNFFTLSITVDNILTQTLMFFIFKTIMIIIYSLFFKKIYDYFSSNKFIIIVVLLIIFGSLLMLSINIYVDLQKLFSMFVMKKNTLFYNIFYKIKIINNYSGIILKQFHKMYFSSFLNIILQSWNLGMILFSLGIILFHLTVLAGIFISYIDKSKIKIMFLSIDNHRYYLYWLLFLFSLVLIFFYIFKIHFISYILLSIIIGCGFVFFLVGRDILYFLIISVVGVENFIVVHLLFRLIILAVPSLVLILTILGFLDAFFNIKKNVLFI
ncbi:hypothetical protein AB836_01605 [Rickettsiales bacterium (ex Bugula neritina AB1)]|nr:hypothetical protein AB836_01605 [Rickettsiales bacterium (ex Bugula neritina AB1)]